MSTSRKAPPVEPLSNAAWQRVEKRVFDELDAAALTPTPTARSAWQRPVLFAMSTAVVALALLLVLRPSPLPDASPSRIVTTDTATEVRIARANIVVGPQSEMIVEQGDDGAVFILATGSARYQVDKRRDDERFVVRAGLAEISVVGTEFSVTRVDDSATVEVLEGIVDVRYRGRQARVTAGQSWPESTTAMSPPAAVPPSNAPDAVVAADGPVAKPPQKTARRTKRLTRSPAKEPTKAAETLVTRDKDLYRRAAQLESSDPKRALALYETLAKGEGTWARIALFAQARLLVERGHEARAKRLLRRYLRRYPSGANATDARQLLQRIDGRD